MVCPISERWLLPVGGYWINHSGEVFYRKKANFIQVQDAVAKAVIESAKRRGLYQDSSDWGVF